MGPFESHLTFNIKPVKSATSRLNINCRDVPIPIPGSDRARYWVFKVDRDRPISFNFMADTYLSIHIFSIYICGNCVE